MSVRNTAALLHNLLNELPPRGRYRQIWLDKAEKPRTGQLSQAAVARVITEHLMSTGRSAPDPRTLRSLVSRALTGERLTKETLELFIDAFAMTKDDAEKLRLLLAGGRPSDIDNKSRAFRVDVEAVDALIRDSFPGKGKHDTQALAERIVRHFRGHDS